MTEEQIQFRCFLIAIFFNFFTVLRTMTPVHEAANIILTSRDPTVLEVAQLVIASVKGIYHNILHSVLKLRQALWPKASGN